MRAALLHILTNPTVYITLRKEISTASASSFLSQPSRIPKPSNFPACKPASRKVWACFFRSLPSASASFSWTAKSYAGCLCRGESALGWIRRGCWGIRKCAAKTRCISTWRVVWGEPDASGKHVQGGWSCVRRQHYAILGDVDPNFKFEKFFRRGMSSFFLLAPSWFSPFLFQRVRGKWEKSEINVRFLKADMKLGVSAPKKARGGVSCPGRDFFPSRSLTIIIFSL